ncbi:hypothetical protein M8J76_004660 [Diaphorina citri]|nr:hypothetical protein M8J76_004660 [Diaphorina citri]
MNHIVIFFAWEISFQTKALGLDIGKYKCCCAYRDIEIQPEYLTVLPRGPFAEDASGSSEAARHCSSQPNAALPLLPPGPSNLSLYSGASDLLHSHADLNTTESTADLAVSDQQSSWDGGNAGRDVQVSAAFETPEVDLLLQRDAPSVEKAARELLSSVAESNVSDGSDNITDIATSPLPPCHLNPDTLLGRLNVSLAVPSWDDEIPHVLFGGEWKPPHCISRDLVAVVIPYRDRKSHLITLLHHLHPILQRQMLHYKIFVVEQAGNDTFNKGVLMNSAFKLILQHHTYPGAVIFHCFVFHDVDLLMEDDRNMLSCPPMPRHLSVAVDSLGYKLPYNNLVGGVFIIRTEHFLRVNGYSNLYWGWGGEDDDMGFRVLQLGLQITRPLPQLGRYKMMKHHKRVPLTTVVKKKLLMTSKRRYRLDGLNTLKFTHLETKAEKYFTRLVVSVGTPPPKIIQLQAVFEKNRQAKKKPPPPYKPAKLPT